MKAWTLLARNRNAIQLGMLTAILIFSFLAFYRIGGALGELEKNNQERAKSVREIVEILGRDNARQTTILKRQDRLLGCLLVMHDANVQVPRSTRQQCEEDVKDFYPPTPTTLPNENGPPPQENKQPNSGGGEETPEDPSILEELLNDILSIES